MDRRPILILQMQRMGDLILTFPLVLWLSRLYPHRRIWIVAEQLFFNELMPLSPTVAYIPWEQTAKIESEEFLLCLNLSHRPEAAALSARLKVEKRLGPALRENGASYVYGPWRLHRASLVNNNRHNRFHWAELNGLDVAPLELIRNTRWPEPNVAPPDSGARERVGLFLGASQEEKRPPEAFWIELVRELTLRGLAPVLLGGPAENELAGRVAQATRCVNLSGRFKLRELASFLRELGLLVTPDTGPMHLAAWIGLRCLNLSMGPVNPWETGPYQHGHYVLQAAMSCAGCWRCVNPRPYACREAFPAGKVAFLVRRLTSGKRLEGVELPGLKLSVSTRASDGLYRLAPLAPEPKAATREALGEFWRAYFGSIFGIWERNRAAEAWATLAETAPSLAPALHKSLGRLSARFSLALRSPAARQLDDAFWSEVAPVARPLSGHLHLLLQNTDFSDKGFARSLELVERLYALTR